MCEWQAARPGKTFLSAGSLQFGEPCQALFSGHREFTFLLLLTSFQAVPIYTAMMAVSWPETRATIPIFFDQTTLNIAKQYKHI